MKPFSHSSLTKYEFHPVILFEVDMQVSYSLFSMFIAFATQALFS